MMRNTASDVNRELKTFLFFVLERINAYIFWKNIARIAAKISAIKNGLKMKKVMMLVAVRTNRKKDTFKFLSSIFIFL